MQPSATVLWKP